MTLLKQVMIMSVQKILLNQLLTSQKKIKSYAVNNIAFSSILMKKIVSINKIIKKVNNEIASICTAKSFHFICKDMIGGNIIWKDGLHLINNVTKVSATDFLKYLKCF